MKNHRPSSSTPFTSLRAPVSPRKVRERALEAAAGELRSGKVTTVWEEVWNSRSLRLAWSGSALALLAGHLLLTVVPEPPARTRLTVAGGRRPGELEAVLRLPSGDISRRAAALALGVSRRSRPPVPGREPAAPPSKESSDREVPS